MRAIGIDDSVSTCDCCGKSGLKSTVVMQSDDGEQFHYGSTCASRNSGKSSRQINGEVKAEAERVKCAASAELVATPEYTALMARYAIRPLSLFGRPAVDFIRAELDAEAAVRETICKKYGVRSINA